MNAKVVLQFIQPSKGWEEVYYSIGSDLQTIANKWLSAAYQFIFYRDVITSLIKIRVTDTLNPRSTLIVSPTTPLIGTHGGGDRGAAVAGTSAVLALNPASGGGPKRFLWVRGLWQGDVGRYETNGQPWPSSSLRTALNGNHMAALATVGAAIRWRSAAGPTTSFRWMQATAVTGASATGQATISFLNPYDTTFSLGDLVYFSQFDQKLYPALKGIYSVISYTAGPPAAITVAYQVPEGGTFPVTVGRFRLVQYNYSPISGTLGGFQNFGTRDTGKDPTGGRGRKSAKRLRLSQ